MNTVGHLWNCPIVAYGPGDSNLDHTPQENIVIAEYHNAINVLANVLRNLNTA
jgi:LysW-gamma-L-lysine carboxypeptidase